MEYPLLNLEGGVGGFPRGLFPGAETRRLNYPLNAPQP